MRLNRCLGTPGRPRSVVEIEKRIRCDLGERRCCGRRRKARDVDHRAACGRNGSCTLEQAFLGKQRGRLAIGDDQLQASLGITSVEWNVGVSAPAYSED